MLNFCKVLVKSNIQTQKNKEAYKENFNTYGFLTLKYAKILIILMKNHVKVKIHLNVFYISSEYHQVVHETVLFEYQ